MRFSDLGSHDALVGVTRNSPPTSISTQLRAGYSSARKSAPSEMYQLFPHVSNDVAGRGPEDSPTLLNCTRIPFTRREQEDQVIGQLTTPELASNEPSKFCLFLRNPGIIRRNEMGKMCAKSSHVSHRFVLV
jgi:hypothetical protein